MIYLVQGTKAQYIKMAPVVRELDRRGLPYQLIDTGQHASFSQSLRSELGIREPDAKLRVGPDIDAVGQATRWFASLAIGSSHKACFGEPGVAVVHGDTPSTLLGLILAKRAKLQVAHVESGLRSWSWFHPFPEEAIRVAVMRRADLLFAPSAGAVDNLQRMGVKGRVVETPGNTSVEELFHVMGAGDQLGPIVATVHRVENLRSRDSLVRFLDALDRLCDLGHDVLFVMHPPTRRALEDNGLSGRIRDSGYRVTELIPHADFVEALRQAPLVLTDGGSIQEECAAIGVPTVLWRETTERHDGLGRNVVVSGRDPSVVVETARNAPSLRKPSRIESNDRPSRLIVDELEAFA